VTGVKFFSRVKNGTFPAIGQDLTLSGQVATGNLTAEQVRYPQIESYFSIEFSNNTSILVPQEGASAPAITPVLPIERVLRIPGQTGNLQKKVLVLKWNE
jgi:hypothetical protein